MSIRFGTSGWRAIIADEFTFDNVRRVINAICGYLKTTEFADRPLIIANDTRFMGEEFGRLAAEIAASKGFKVLLCTAPAPTPAVSRAVINQRAAGAINFTASHNPPEYQGIKFSTSDGAPALPEVTRQIENLIAKGEELTNIDGGFIEEFDPKEDYLSDLESKINFSAIAASGGSFAYDPLWGTGRGYLDEVLRRHKLEVRTIHDWRDVLFGGRSPEPAADHLDELESAVLSEKHTLGLATDGDADRFGVIDSDGTFIEPNKLIALLADYLLETRGLKLGVARSVATSHLIDRVAAAHNVQIHETPVGFKFIGELIKQGRIILGGEESAGLSINGHYPEKDGILACLLAAEAVATRGESLGSQLESLYSRVGRLESKRVSIKVDDNIAARLKEKLDNVPTEIGGRRVSSVNRIDGVKFVFDNQSWLLVRPSGTEPVIRVYAESATLEDLEELIEQGKSYLLG